LTSSQLQSNVSNTDVSTEQNSVWGQFLEHFYNHKPLPISQLESIFGPLQQPCVDDMVVIGQIGQTIDGRIATVSGQSKYVNGPSGLTHLHQLRALVDGIIVGVGTVIADNPQLTVRLVYGKNPARIVIDPSGRLSQEHLIWQDDGVLKIWIVAEGTTVAPPTQVKLIKLPAIDGVIEPTRILKHLSTFGLRRILIEGGAKTVSQFMLAKCLDRMHVIVAPILMGSGRLSFNLPEIEHMDQALRLEVKTHVLGNDVLFDCDLSKQRVVLMTEKEHSELLQNSQ
jgi:diaminohydroxyphosphoribosylaminopyrimidine deaminase / 5-amino-6-(5-phosphoribosylamino)uracil reductase